MKNKLLDLMSEILETEVHNNSSIENIETWDSLNHIKLILEIENKFGVKVPFEKIPELTSTDSILKFLEEK